jgi:glycerol kinase
MPYVLALDQGTTSSRAILFDSAGRVVQVAQREFRQYFSNNGWVEHDAEEIWESQYSVMQDVCLQSHVRPDDIAAIGITNQRETTVVWDRKTGKPICNAIVWQDKRTAPRCRELVASGEAKDITKRTGLVVDSYFSASKVEWILKNVAGARKKAERGELAFGTVDSWLLWRLTQGKVHATDTSNASRTMLYNIHKLKWDEALLERFGVAESMLPEVRSSSEIYGHTELLGKPIPVAGIAGDQQAALFGQACHEPGMVKNTYGTGCFMLMNTGDKPIRSKNKLLTTIAWTIDGKTEYALEGSVFVGGAVVQWLRDGLGILQKSSDVEELARQVPDNGGVYFVPAFTGLGTPHWNPNARGTITGLTRGSSAAHIARASLEGIAYQVHDLLDAMQADSGISLKQLRVDGGACCNNLMMQFEADLLRVPVVRPRIQETTALGAAYLAGLAVGFWKNKQQIAKQWQVEATFKPKMKPKERQQLLAGWHRALKAAQVE